MFNEKTSSTPKTKYFLPDRGAANGLPTSNKGVNKDQPALSNQRQHVPSQTTRNLNYIQSNSSMPAHNYASFASNNSNFSSENYNTSPLEAIKQDLTSPGKNSRFGSVSETPESLRKYSYQKQEDLPKIGSTLSDQPSKPEDRSAFDDTIASHGKNQYTTPFKQLSASQSSFHLLTSAQPEPQSPSRLDIMFAKHWRSFSVPTRSQRNKLDSLASSNASASVESQNPWATFVKEYCSKGCKIVDLIKQGKDYLDLLNIKLYLDEKAYLDLDNAVKKASHDVMNESKKMNSAAIIDSSPSCNQNTFGNYTTFGNDKTFENLIVRASPTLKESNFQQPLPENHSVVSSYENEPGGGPKFQSFEGHSVDTNEGGLQTSTVIESSSKEFAFPVQARPTFGSIDATSDETKKGGVSSHGFESNEKYSNEIRFLDGDSRNPKIPFETQNEEKKTEEMEPSPTFNQEGEKNYDETELFSHDNRRPVESTQSKDQGYSMMNRTSGSIYAKLVEKMNSISEMQNAAKTSGQKRPKSMEAAKKKGPNNSVLGCNKEKSTNFSKQDASNKPPLASNRQEKSVSGFHPQEQAASYNSLLESRRAEEIVIQDEETPETNVDGQSNKKKGPIYLKISLLSPKNHAQRQPANNNGRKLVYVSNIKNKAVHKEDSSRGNKVSTDPSLSGKQRSLKYFTKQPLSTTRESLPTDQLPLSSERTLAKKVSFSNSSESSRSKSPKILTSRKH